MTTPDEHRRNLGWTISTMTELRDGATPGSDVAVRAAYLLPQMPSVEQLEALDSAEPAQVEAAIKAIENASGLFTTALRHVENPGLRRVLEVTLRHYPTPAHFDFWRQMAARGAPMGTVILRKDADLS